MLALPILLVLVSSISALTGEAASDATPPIRLGAGAFLERTLEPGTSVGYALRLAAGESA